ncbi:hypothetical protein DFH27DRAFT_555524 [Peziza echinospora]|nr:hypothetical protein DFH27DRAFT_555524 [Peziza echinospora]
MSAFWFAWSSWTLSSAAPTGATALSGASLYFISKIFSTAWKGICGAKVNIMNDTKDVMSEMVVRKTRSCEVSWVQ